MADTKNMPLAARMRPKQLNDVLGQEHILAPGKLLYRAIQADQLGSIILYGPPGTGKTSLANVIANETQAHFLQINATTSGKKDMEACVKQAQERLDATGQKTILFIDEIHRFTKAQQDFLLPFVESGLITLIGATTENPYFEVNKALISRSRVFELKPLSMDDVMAAILRALREDEILKSLDMTVTDDALRFLSDAVNGDVRSALNALELAALTIAPDSQDSRVLDLDTAQECIQKKAVMYDKDGDQHYDVISAFIKSMRGSDPQAVLYYLARMLAAGEDIKFIARRIMIHACEDVGLADPMALVVATNASLACERIGLPEANLILAEAALYVACAPKSNSVCSAINAAQKLVNDTGTLPVPPHLQDSHYKGAAKLGHGQDYKYPHDFPNHYVKQQYLPDAIQDAWFYRPTRMGQETQVADRLNYLIWSELQRTAQEPQNAPTPQNPTEGGPR